MPWSRAKALPPPDNTLFEACFRIQSEACEAAGRHIPLIVENVRGAQKWVGRARWNYGSFYLWGDVPALMPVAVNAVKAPGMNWSDQTKRGQDFTRLAGRHAMDGIKHHASGAAWFAGAPDKMLGHAGPAKFSSKSTARKAASAMIAKIPLPLSQHIARVFADSAPLQGARAARVRSCGALARVAGGRSGV